MSHELSHITVSGASEQNLKDINVAIPRNAITVITGVSGSGKSTLAFDTILNEAQRRFFYTLSHYSRQFLALGTRAKVRRITGLSPAIALAQNETQPSSRASVGSQSDLTELLGVMFARFGERRCPQHSLPTGALPREEMLAAITRRFSNNTMLAICAPLAEQKKGHFEQQLSKLVHKGFLKASIDGTIRHLTPLPRLNKEVKHTIKVIIDQVQLKASNRARLERSLITALNMANDTAEVFPLSDEQHLDLNGILHLSARDGCPSCGFSWPSLDPRYFSPNSLGRCSACAGSGCEGLGNEDDETAANEAEDEEEASIAAWTPLLPCGSCRGTGIKAEMAHVRLNEISAIDAQLLSLAELNTLLTNTSEAGLLNNPAFMRVREEIQSTLRRLLAIGLGYLHLGRRVRTLSAGEAQRLRLASLLGEQLRGITYVLDEPSQGLHPEELVRLHEHLVTLRDLGNTIIIVDHDEGIIRAADHIIDLGPCGGSQGGYVLAEFAPAAAEQFKDRSQTAAYLCSRSGSDKYRRHHQGASEPEQQKSEAFFRVHAARLHNLAIDEVSFKIGALNCITGVSGAGKSNLVLRTIYPLAAEYFQQLGRAGKSPRAAARTKTSLVGLPCGGISGLEELLGVQIIDRRPIAKSSISMPATYLDIFTYLRTLYAKVPEAQLLGLTPRMFSLSVNGGRCAECGGRGELLKSMKFLADARVLCPLCQGKRYQDHLLDIRYQGVNIGEALSFTIDEACAFFKNHRLLYQRLKPAQDLGLGYLKLGQPSRTLSGGEAQRLKLAPLLTMNKRVNQKQLVILDEPTQGLHPQDIEALLTALGKLCAEGSTLLVIEHSMQVIAHSHWLVDLGPGAAGEGGKLVFQGNNQGLAKCRESISGRYFAQWLQR